jgi:hypothetical protein
MVLALAFFCILSGPTASLALDEDEKYAPFTFDVFPANSMQYFVTDGGSLTKAGLCDGDSMAWGCFSAFLKHTRAQGDVMGAEVMVFAEPFRSSLTPYLGYGIMLGLGLDKPEPVAGVFLEGGLRYTFTANFQMYTSLRAYATTQCCDNNVFVGLGVLWKWNQLE